MDDDDFIQRLLLALNENTRQLARNIGVRTPELWDRRGAPGQQVPIDRDIFWIKLSDYVARRIGELVSVHEELNRKLAKDRKRRLHERLRQENR